MTCRFLDPQQSASFLRSTLECRRLPFSELRSNPYNDCTRLATLLRGLRDCIEKTSRRILQRLLKSRSEEHTSELQSQSNLVCRLLLEKTIHEIQGNKFSLVCSSSASLSDTQRGAMVYAPSSCGLAPRVIERLTL